MSASFQTIIKFLDKLCKNPNTGCWDWVACKVKRGYGKFGFNGETQLAHRVSWQIFKGYIPKGLVLHHKCNNTSCVNPNHLELVTQGVHIRELTPKSILFKNKLKTTCPYGHPYVAGLGTRNNPRRCKECRKIRTSRARALEQATACIR